jgi:nucleotide-binding universal stress UspA family protein
MNILYATDGSDGARTAGRLLASLPLPPGARITVLSAISSDDWVESMIFADTSVQEVKTAQRHAEEAASALGYTDPLPIARGIGSGSAAAAILDQAEANAADLIVVGSHGMGAMERFLIGSVSERVARYAHTSVLVARRDRVERVIVAVDGSESSEQALDAVARLPLPAESTLSFVYVAPIDDKEVPASRSFYPEYAGLSREYRAERRAAAERILGHAEQRLRAAGQRAEVSIRWGDPAGQLIAAAQEWGADLIITGSANRSTLGRLFLGSVSGYILGHAPCSVLVARLARAPEMVEVPETELAGVHGAIG